MNPTDEHEKELQKRLIASRVQDLAAAIIRRADQAGIPKDYQKIPQKEFRDLLYDSFYTSRNQSPDKITDAIYNHTSALFSKMFILIDGGDILGIQRNKAGYAILFKLISKDLNGKFIQGKSLIHTFNDFSIDRIAVVEELKRHDVLFLSEISLQDFRLNTDSGSFFDELLEYRFSNSLPTIISFSRPVSSLEKSEINDERAGRFLLQLYHADVRKNEKLIYQDLKSIRIRVKQ